MRYDKHDPVKPPWFHAETVATYALLVLIVGAVLVAHMPIVAA